MVVNMNMILAEKGWEKEWINPAEDREKCREDGGYPKGAILVICSDAEQVTIVACRMYCWDSY
jgi:hypothetical protein